MERAENRGGEKQSEAAPGCLLPGRADDRDSVMIAEVFLWRRAVLSLAVLFCICPIVSAQGITASQIIERLDRHVLNFGKAFAGGPAQLPGALLASELRASTLELTVPEWKALAGKVDHDLAALERRGDDSIPPAVFVLDLASLEDGSLFGWRDAPQSMFLLMRAYDVASASRLGTSLALPQHLAGAEEFAKETVLWGFTSSEMFMTIIDGRDALASAQGSWITTTTFARTPNGLIKPETIRLHPRY